MDLDEQEHSWGGESGKLGFQAVFGSDQKRAYGDGRGAVVVVADMRTGQRDDASGQWPVSLAVSHTRSFGVVGSSADQAGRKDLLGRHFFFFFLGGMNLGS